MTEILNFTTIEEKNDFQKTASSYKKCHKRQNDRKGRSLALADYDDSFINEREIFNFFNSGKKKEKRKKKYRSFQKF